MSYENKSHSVKIIVDLCIDQIKELICKNTSGYSDNLRWIICGRIINYLFVSHYDDLIKYSDREIKRFEQCEEVDE